MTHRSLRSATKHLRRRLAHLLASLAMFSGALVICDHAVAQEAAAPTPATMQGRLGTLPGVEGVPAPSDALGGHFRLLERTIDRAIADLQNGDLKAFVVSYKLMVETYVQVADQLGDASESLGEAMAQIVLARMSLMATADANATTDSPPQSVSPSELADMRDYLHGKIAAVRARLEAARPADQESLLGDLQTLVERAEQLEQMSKAAETTGRPLLPGMASSELDKRLTEVEEALKEEKRMVEVVGSLARDVTKSASKDLRNTMRFLEIDARIPREQLDRLQVLRANLQRTVKQIETTRDDARRNAMRILVNNSSRSTRKVPAEELLQRADRLLKRSPEPESDKTPAGGGGR
jgi:hypothetical protein